MEVKCLDGPNNSKTTPPKKTHFEELRKSGLYNEVQTNFWDGTSNSNYIFSSIQLKYAFKVRYKSVYTCKLGWVAFQFFLNIWNVQSEMNVIHIDQTLLLKIIQKTIVFAEMSKWVLNPPWYKIFNRNMWKIWVYCIQKCPQRSHGLNKKEKQKKN